MFSFFERLLTPTAAPEHPEPPAGLLAFFWHFARQAKWLFVALFAVELLVALTDSAIPWFIGQIVTLVTSTPRDQFLAVSWPLLAGMGFVVLIMRPAVTLARYLITNQAIAAPFTGLIRWQSHWHVVRQSWAFFQNDFAGRISTRVMQTGPAVRSTLVASVTAGWYILVYGTTAVVMTAAADLWLMVPILLWFAGYIALLWYFVPRMRDRSKRSSEARSSLMGRIVDSYTNILTVKLFARPSDEDEYVRDAVDRHTNLFISSQRLITMFGTLLAVLNALLMAGAGGLAILLWLQGAIAVGAIAMVLPLTFQLTNMSRQIAVQITDIFEEIGVVQEGMLTIARPLQLVDPEGAKALIVREGRIAFEAVEFGYGREAGVLQGFTLNVAPGEKIGLVGRSGAGKSTVVNLMLRFFDLEGGRILIDGQDISQLTQESLRSQISVVTQDTSLLHRSIAREHPLRAAGRERRGSDGGGEARACARVHPGAGGLARAARLRGACGRARGEAVRRPAPARRDRARDPEERADPGARRGHLRARQRGGGRDPVEPRHADGRQDRDRDRAPAVHHRAHGPAGGARPRPHHRAGHAQRAARARRPLRLAVEAAIGRLHRRGAGGGGGGVEAA